MPKILIIEDYQSLLKIYEDEFKRNNFDVELAANGDEGLQLASNEDFDVILLDLLMPQADGFDFLERYKASEHSRAKVIIMSNVYSHEYVNKALNLGASQYLLKSDITPQRIREIVQQTLEADKNSKA
jgi:two-component system copper resistance phosphate regulon response regulator CusR